MEESGGRRLSAAQSPVTRSATRITVSTFGAIAGLAGIEHGIGEVLQGNVPPDGVMILSWPDSEVLDILAGEPAMTVVPNLLVTGMIAIFVSAVFLVWATVFVDRRRGGPVLIGLSVVLLLVGGGFGPPILGLILGAARMNVPPDRRRAYPSNNRRRFLAGLWPWSFFAAMIAWLSLLPGTVLLDRFVGVGNPYLLVPALGFSAFGLLLLTIFAAFARDALRSSDPHPKGDPP